MRTRITVPALLALMTAACGKSSNDGGQWLTMPTAATHAKFFPLAGTVHDPSAPGSTITCDSCHAAPASAAAFTSFVQVDCVTCHNDTTKVSATADSFHVGTVAGYLAAGSAGAPASPWPYSQQMCLTCHPTGTASMADHGKFFPIGSGTSHNFACTQCHGNPTAKQDISKQQCNVCHGNAATDPQATTFATVHAQTAIGKDFTASSACGGASATTCPQSCLGCHALDLLQTVASHPSISVPHQGATCLRCHDFPLRTDLEASPMPPGAPTTSPQPYALDFATDPRGGSTCSNLAAKTGCYSCHTTCPPGGN